MLACTLGLMPYPFDERVDGKTRALLNKICVIISSIFHQFHISSATKKYLNDYGLWKNCRLWDYGSEYQ